MLVGRVHPARAPPEAPGQPGLACDTSRQLMSLRPGDQSRPIPAATFAAEHQCGFWNAQQAPAGLRPDGSAAGGFMISAWARRP